MSLEEFRKLWMKATKDYDWNKHQEIIHTELAKFARFKYKYVEEVNPTYDVFLGGYKCKLKNGLWRVIWINEFLMWLEREYNMVLPK